MMDDSDRCSVGQPPAHLVDLCERVQAWSEAWTADMVRLSNRLWWLRDIAPTWPAEQWAEQWEQVRAQAARLAPAAAELVEVLAEFETPAAVG